MRTVMSFSSEKALKCLLSRGFVFTFRKNKRKHVGEVWTNKGRGTPKVKNAFCQYLGYVFPYMLAPYVRSSGFATLEEWHNEIKQLNGGILPNSGYLYEVTLEK